jgi:hypothetical protein
MFPGVLTASSNWVAPAMFGVSHSSTWSRWDGATVPTAVAGVVAGEAEPASWVVAAGDGVESADAAMGAASAQTAMSTPIA